MASSTGGTSHLPFVLWDYKNDPVNFPPNIKDEDVIKGVHAANGQLNIVSWANREIHRLSDTLQMEN